MRGFRVADRGSLLALRIGIVPSFAPPASIRFVLDAPSRLRIDGAVTLRWRVPDARALALGERLDRPLQPPPPWPGDLDWHDGTTWTLQLLRDGHEQRPSLHTPSALPDHAIAVLALSLEAAIALHDAAAVAWVRALGV